MTGVADFMVNPIVSAEEARPVTPNGLLVSHLASAMRLAEKTVECSSEMVEHLQIALNLAAGLEDYISALTTAESTELAAIAQKTRLEPWNHRYEQGCTVRHLEQEMLSGHVEGQTLKMFVYMTRARRILDIGMFTGYSALAMAEALPDDGVLVACEVDSYVSEVAQHLFQSSPHGTKIQVMLGQAIDSLTQLAATQEPFDLVFIDADKQEYEYYFRFLLESDLLAQNGFICVDNTLFQGQVYLPESDRSANGNAIAKFNAVVAQDPRVEQVILPLRDGLTIIRRK